MLAKWRTKLVPQLALSFGLTAGFAIPYLILSPMLLFHFCPLFSFILRPPYHVVFFTAYAASCTAGSGNILFLLHIKTHKKITSTPKKAKNKRQKNVSNIENPKSEPQTR